VDITTPPGADARVEPARGAQGVYAEPFPVADLTDCYFYHTMEIPGHGLVEGQWDLRGRVDEYTGGVDFKGRRVLEIGTASGFLCFQLEAQGAEVVSYDLSAGQSWDIVPMASVDLATVIDERRAIMHKINNGYWYAHAALGSHAKVVYGTVYEIPLGIGTVDISTFCSVLLHLRDPFLALQNALRLTADTVVVTDMVSPYGPVGPGTPARPRLEFVPEFRKGGPTDTWWFLTPDIVQEFLGVLGFEDSTVTHHRQKAYWGEAELFTVVAHRTQGQPVSS
jgi:SAM-dependent methyltransferase